MVQFVPFCDVAYPIEKLFVSLGVDVNHILKVPSSQNYIWSIKCLDSLMLPLHDKTGFDGLFDQFMPLLDVARPMLHFVPS